MDFYMILCNNLLGNTPMVKLNIYELPNINLYAKLEGYNPTGSIKDRAADYILKTALKTGLIDMETTIIESSSGNFGIALASVCKKLNLKFHCVIDPNITETNEIILKSICNTITKVSKFDENGGYLGTRIAVVKETVEKQQNIYWVNQYQNKYNRDAYLKLGSEICDAGFYVDYIFVAVSSGGTISGVSRKIKELSPGTKVVAVDSEGSVVFGGTHKKRTIPGIGSSIVPDIIKDALIDDVVKIDEKYTYMMAEYILHKYGILLGGSSATVMCAVFSLLKDRNFNEKPNVVMIFPDRGDRYIGTLYK